MRRAALVVAAALLAAAGLGALAPTPARADVSAPANGRLRWRTDAAAAEREAIKGHRPLLLFFSADWCMPCKEMLRRSFADAAVSELVARRFVPLLVDVTDDESPARAIRDRYRVVALPTLLVRDGERERLRQESFVEAPQLRAALERALAPR